MKLENDPLAAFWMPFTANRAFKATPRQLTSAKDMHYRSEDGRQILDGTAGLWAVNAGHCRRLLWRQSRNARLSWIMHRHSPWDIPWLLKWLCVLPP